MNLKDYKWGYLTALSLFALAPYAYWAGLHEPGPPDWESSPGMVVGWFVLFFLAGIGVLFRNSFGWYFHYAVLGLVGSLAFVLGWADPMQEFPKLFSLFGVVSLIAGLVLLNLIPIQRWYWRREQGKDTGSLRRHLLYLNSSLLLVALIGYLIVFLTPH